MKKIGLLLVLSGGIMCSSLQAMDLAKINRDILAGIGFSLDKTANLGATFVALCGHAYMKGSSNPFERDKQLMYCLAGGWLGDAFHNAIETYDLPECVKVPLQHPFAFSYLMFNVINKKSDVLQDKASWAVGFYLLANLADRYWYKTKWPFTRKEPSRK